MKKIHPAFIIGIVVIIAYFGLQYVMNESNETEGIAETVVTDYNLTFTYLAGEQAYTLVEPPIESPLLDAYIILRSDDFSMYDATASDAPPTMSVFVFATPVEPETDGERPGRITRLQTWAQANANLTGIDRAYGAPEVVEIDGLQALRYDIDAVYQQMVYLASYQGHIYMFVGQSERPTDAIKRDFDTFMSNLIFE